MQLHLHYLPTVITQPLAHEDLVNVALTRNRVPLLVESVKKMEELRITLEHLAEQGNAIYGPTTGFGTLSETRMTLGQANELQTNLLTSHALGADRAPSTGVVPRPMMLLRLNTVFKGL